MNYAAARHLIHDGDTIAVRRRDGLFANLIRIITHSPYTHLGIALWSHGRLLVWQMNGAGNNLVLCSQFNEFDVFRCPVGREIVADVAWGKMRKHIPYAFIDLLGAAVQQLMHLRLPKSGWQCSSAANDLYVEAGWTNGVDGIATPGEVVARLVLVVEVR